MLLLPSQRIYKSKAKVSRKLQLDAMDPQLLDKWFLAKPGEPHPSPVLAYSSLQTETILESKGDIVRTKEPMP